jgi:hypothetical protein
MHGLDYRAGERTFRGFLGCVELDALKNRTLVFYGSAAAVIILVGLAFGAGRRSQSEEPS